MATHARKRCPNCLLVFPLIGRATLTIAPCIAIESCEISWGIRLGIMPRILKLIGSMGFVAILLASGVELRTARADDCLAQPNSSAPEGSHWYYHTDRATQRKCWYLRGPDQPAQQSATQSTSQAATTNSVPLENPATLS